MDLVERGLVHDYGAAVVASIGPRQKLQRLQSDLESILLKAMEDDHQSTYTRTFDIDETLRGKCKEMREVFAHLLDGSWPLLEDSLRSTEAHLEVLIMKDRNRILCTEPCQSYSRLGAGYWKINPDSPVLHTPKMQSILCIVFTGNYTFITGTEDGSLYFWDGFELVGAAPLHKDAIVDMTIDMNGYESRGYFHLVTAGYDGTVRLSRCDRFEQGLRGKFYSGIVLLPLQTVTLPIGITMQQPSPAVSISNIIGLDKFSGLPCIHWVDKPARHVSFNMESGVQFSQEEVRTRKQSFVVGTCDNNLFLVNFEDTDSQASATTTACFPIVQAHSVGGISCISAHPRQPNIIFSGGEDGVARMWDVALRRLQKYYFAVDAITSSDFSPTGDVVAAGLARGGFLVLDSNTMLPKSQVVFEFEVLVLPNHQDDNPLAWNTTSGPMSQSDKDLQRRLDHLTSKRDYLVRRSKGEENIPAEALPEWEKWVHEIKRIEQSMFTKQEKMFKGSYFALESRSMLSRRRMNIQELKLMQLSGTNLKKAEQDDLIHATLKEEQLERKLIASIEYQPLSGTVMIKFDSPISKPPHGRATIQTFRDIVRHSKRSTLVLKFSPDNRLLAVGGLDKMVYVHQVPDVTCPVCSSRGK